MENNEEQEDQPTVFVLWFIEANSWNGSRVFKSVHSSIISALNDIPESCLNTSMERPLTGREVANFTYFVVTEEPLFTKTG